MTSRLGADGLHYPNTTLFIRSDESNHRNILSIVQPIVASHTTKPSHMCALNMVHFCPPAHLNLLTLQGEKATECQVPFKPNQIWEDRGTTLPTIGFYVHGIYYLLTYGCKILITKTKHLKHFSSTSLFHCHFLLLTAYFLLLAHHSLSKAERKFWTQGYHIALRS